MKNYFFQIIDYSFYTLKVMKNSDGMGIQIFIGVTFYRLTEIVNKFID